MSDARSGQGLPRSARLLRRADFLRVQARRRSGWRSRDLIIRHAPRAARQGARFGFTVSRRVGNAVVRNRVKRWLREATRREAGSLQGIDVVFIARPSAATAGYHALREQVARALRRLERGAR